VVPDYIDASGSVRTIRYCSEFWDHYGIATHTVEPGDLLFVSRNGLVPTHMGVVVPGDKYVCSPGMFGGLVELRDIPPQHEIPPHPGSIRQLYRFNPIGYKAITTSTGNDGGRYHQTAVT